VDNHRFFVFTKRGLFGSPSLIAIENQGDQWNWEQKTVKGSFPRQHLKGHVIGQNVFVAGLTNFRRKGLFCLDSSNFTSTEVTMIDLSSQKSTKRLNFTFLVSETTHNPDKIWFFGENYLNSKNDNMPCEVAVWNKGNNTIYSAIANTLPIVGNGPREKKDLKVVAVGNDKIFVIAPDINKTKLEIYTLDTERLEWALVKTKGNKPVNPNPGFSVTAVGKNIIFLGYNMSLNSRSMEAYLLDTDSNTWEKADLDGDVITPRHDHTATQINGKELLVVGGKGHGFFSTSIQDFFKLKVNLS